MVHGHCTPTTQHKLTLFEKHSPTHQRATWIKFSNLRLIKNAPIPYQRGRERGRSQWCMDIAHLPLNTNWPCLRRIVPPINGPHGLSSATYSGICLIKYASIPYQWGRERGRSQWCMDIAHLPLNTNWPCLTRIVLPINGPHGLRSATYSITRLIKINQGRERGWSQGCMDIAHLPLNTNWPCLRRIVPPINGPHGFSSATYSGMCLIKYASIPYKRGRERGRSQYSMHIAQLPLNTNWPCLIRIVPLINGLSSATYVILIIDPIHTGKRGRAEPMVHVYYLSTPQHKLTLFEKNSLTHQRATWILCSNL